MTDRAHSILETWFPSRGARFIEEHYRARRPCVEHGDLARFGLNPAEYRDVHDLIRSARRTYPITSYVRGSDGVTRPVNLEPEDAIVQYDRGATVSVESGVVNGDCQLGLDLWESLGCLRALASRNPATLLSPAGATVPPHFDRIDAFVLVVSGRKEWTIAPNAVDFPSTSHFESGADPRGGAPKPRRRPSYIDERALEMPVADRQRFVMTSGSVAFVPSGWWHTTRAIEPTLSYTFRGWIEPITTLILSALAPYLERYAHWRAPLLMPGHEAMRQEILVTIESVLQRLGEDVRGLEASAVLAQACGAELLRVAARPYAIDHNRGTPLLTFSSPEGLDQSHPISAGVATVLSWARGRESFFVSDLRRGCAIEPSAQDEALEMLVQHGLFEERYGTRNAIRVHGDPAAPL